MVVPNGRGQLARLLKSRGLPLAVSMILLVLAWGVWSWVQFGQVVGGARGLYTQSDFPAVTIVSRMISEGRGANIYSLDAQLEGQRRLIDEGYVWLEKDAELKYPYPYSPFIAVIMSPMAGLDPNLAWALWDLINIAGMSVGLWFLLSAPALSKDARLALLLGGLASFPFVVNLEQGQSSGMVMFAFGTGIALLKRGRDLPAGLALGLLALKVQWLPFLLLALAWKMRWRALAGLAATGCALAGIAVLVMGWGWIPGYLNMLGKAQNYARELLLDPWYSHSLSGGITALLGPGSDNIVRIANIAAMMGAAVLLVWAWRGKWQPTAPTWDGAMALTVLAAIFTNPMLNTHDLCLLVIPGALGLAYLTNTIRSPQDRIVIYWLAVLWFAFVATAFVLPQIYAMPVRLTTLVMLALAALLVARLIQKPAELPSPTSN